MAASAPQLSDYSVAGDMARARPADVCARLGLAGLVHVRGALPTAETEALHRHVCTELEERRREKDGRWFGSVYGYEDQGKRWDLKLTLGGPVSAALAGLLQTLSPVLLADQPEWELAELAAMCTEPGEPCQPVHADTSHTYDARLLTVFVALHPVDEVQGPTRMYPGTHADEELHTGLKTLDEAGGVLCTMSSGDCVIMDSRLMHCGTANRSQGRRCLFYCSWRQPGSQARGSTSTILESYARSRLALSAWQVWTSQPPEVVLEAPSATCEPASASGDARPACSARPLPPEVRRLLDWLRDAHGVDLAAVGMEVRCSRRHGVGVFATRRAHPGCTLARIPVRASLHAGSARASEFGKRVVAALRGAPISPQELLWLYMIWGRGEPAACPWEPYLSSLPAESPLAWTSHPRAVELLQGTPVGRITARELSRQRERHASLLAALSSAEPLLFTAERFSLDAWEWARACYSSRAFAHEAFPSECLQAEWTSNVLCPLLDIFNHTHGAEVEWRFSESALALVLPVSAEPYGEGAEAFNLYGVGLDNAKLLSTYGFAERGNPHDCAPEVDFPAESGLASACAAAEPPISVAVDGCVLRVLLPDPLRNGALETPQELLRVASLAARGSDYDEAAVTSEEKAAVARVAASALRRMLRGCARQPPTRRGRCVRFRCKRVQGRWATAPLPPGPGRRAERAAWTYLRSYRRILRGAAELAQCEAEMAELSAQMGAGDAEGEAPEDEEDAEMA